MEVRTAANLILATVLLGSPARLFAHHSLSAEFDLTKPVRLVGTVTNVEWINPHARVFVEVKDGGGQVTSWECQLFSPQVLMRRGWTRDSLKPGDRVTVKGNPARDGSPRVHALSVKTRGRHKVFAGSSAAEKAEQ